MSLRSSLTKIFLGLGFCLALASHDVSGATESSLTVTPIGSALEIPATLIRPDGAGPFPAIVIMHDCSGLGPRSSGAPARWSKALVQQGYVVLIPDSFTPRGFPDGVCTIPGSETTSASGYARAADAYGALAALRALPFVDGKRVGVMGNSHGGWTVLAAMVAAQPGGDNALAEAKRNGFAAALALYPSCTPRYGGWSTAREKGSRFGPAVTFSGTYQPLAPLLILTGEKDDWTPAEPCRRLVEASRAAGYPVEIKVYPGAHHGFDNDRPVRYDARRNNPNSPSGRGATTGGDSAASADAGKQVASFFSLHLKQSAENPTGNAAR
ncbi:MAG TPA: dienelactone hydrolase family protein [Burkholderiales bacterium]|nr:dienelactone hydrolase family protein [Burkholderiales bacterium]